MPLYRIVSLTPDENEPNNAKQGPTTSSGKNTAKSDAGESRPRNAK